MVNIAIFASGNGSNFENIIQEINNGHVNNAVCKVLIIDKEHAYAKERAEKLHIPCVYVNPKAYAGKEPYEQKILSILKEHQVELIVLAGYMRFIGKVLLESFPRRIINLHPAYLPNYITEVRADGTRAVRFQPLAPYETSQAIHVICESYNQAIAADIEPLLLIPSFITDFLCIHPFNDGNGRMSRLMTALLLYKSGFEVGKYISIETKIAKTKLNYYEALRS